MAGTLIVSNLTTDTDNTFIVRSNTGTTLFSANTTGIDIANSIGATAITNDKILSIANTKISGNIISSQITSVANTQITGNIISSQITSVANTQITGILSVTNGGTSTSTLTANNVLLGNGTSAVQVVAPGTTGNLLTSNGTTWTSAAAASTYIGGRGQVFTADGTFTVPTGVTAVKVTVIGGGGNGASITATGGCGAGGGGAGTAIEFVTGLTPGGTVAVTVGTAGNTSSFGAFCSATGGTSVAVNGTTGGAGGAGSGGDINLTGGTGAARDPQAEQTGAGGGTTSAGIIGINYSAACQSLQTKSVAGAGMFGAGGAGKTKGDVVGAQNGNAATGFGNGGGGSCSSNATDATGGAGSGGIVIVEF